ncbi:MAG TPA: hypothetical protein VGA38_02080 [Candidatus Limnocylindria bacterium]
MDGTEGRGRSEETDAEREARYFAGYQAIPDADDEDFEAINRLAIEMLRESEE